MTDNEIKNLWKRKKIQIDFDSFKKWYLQQDRKCNYCGITEENIKLLLDTEQLFTKRLKTRGKRLELDRKQADQTYDNLSNLTLSCYWCNNAKTDTFSHDEFLLVGKTMKKIWQQRLDIANDKKEKNGA